MSLTKTFNKGDLLYEGKAKRLFRVQGDETLVFQEFKNSLTALNGLKKVDLEGKGELNRNISSLIFRYLKSQGQSSHWVADSGPTGMVTQKVEIIPLEVVVRNVIAGSLAKKLNQAEGQDLEQAVVDLHYKDDSLADPFINDDQAIYVLKVVSPENLKQLKQLALTINGHLKKLFWGVGLKLVDFKLEFGKLPNGQIILADEISPDTCRLWDVSTGEKRDKDRFRRDLGDVLENYQIVWKNLNQKYGASL